MCACVCGFRALPVMFAVTLDLRIFANNVRVLPCLTNSGVLKRPWDSTLCVFSGGAAAAEEE